MGPPGSPRPRTRRELLFRLWDELLEDDTAGTTGRATIVDFVRRKLPGGSPEAFPTAELDRYNRDRQSQAEFAPYD